MTLSQLYRTLVEQAQWHIAQPYVFGGPGASHIERADEFQKRAGGVAHCIAKFGDMPCEDFIVRHKDEASQYHYRLRGINWKLGVGVVERELSSQKTRPEKNFSS